MGCRLEVPSKLKNGRENQLTSLVNSMIDARLYSLPAYYSFVPNAVPYASLPQDIACWNSIIAELQLALLPVQPGRL